MLDYNGIFSINWNNLNFDLNSSKKLKKVEVLNRTLFNPDGLSNSRIHCKASFRPPSTFLPTLSSTLAEYLPLESLVGCVDWQPMPTHFHPPIANLLQH